MPFVFLQTARSRCEFPSRLLRSQLRNRVTSPSRAAVAIPFPFARGSRRANREGGENRAAPLQGHRNKEELPSALAIPDAAEATQLPQDAAILRHSRRTLSDSGRASPQSKQAAGLAEL